MSQLPVLTPLTRETLRCLKAQKEEQVRAEQEKIRLYQVSRTVYQIYGEARSAAETTGATSYKYKVVDSFQIHNMTDILDSLRILFPDSSVEYSLFVRGNDGQMHDLSKMDEKVRPFVNMQQSQNNIVIDWS